jgi:hypothetical protein
MTMLTARLRKLETATGMDDPFSELTDEELEAAIETLNRFIAQSGMSPEEHAAGLKEAARMPPLDTEHRRELVRRIKAGGYA